ncbi:MAG TPA: hypothetical protein VGM77_05920 [Gemmatimonadales bacterium]|jgi:intracellular sulfur oxidation DsrE/DsrF family protein
MSDTIGSLPRRGFIGAVSVVAAGVSMMGFAEPASAMSTAADPQLEAWFGKLKGKHQVVFDAPGANDGLPAVWPRVYQITMDATYPGEGVSPMVILRHKGLGLAFNDAVWAKYHMGDVFDIKVDGAVAAKNPYAVITTLPLPNLGIAKLLSTGVLIGACDVALTVYSGAAAAKMKLDAAAVKKEWIAGLLPGVQVVPSGVMAVARAQEFGAKYIFAG